MIHHLLSHSDTADWLKVNQFFLEQVAYIARKLDAIQEGQRTLLDNTMLLYCSSMMTGSHDATQLPVVMLGGGGGRIKGGRVLDYNEQARPPDVPALSLDDGQDGCAASEVWRREQSFGRSVISFARLSRSTQALTVLLTAIPALLVAAPAQTRTEANVPIELSFKAEKPHADPFNTVVLDVIFTDPKGVARKVPAFWAGGNQWKVRYSSREPGLHRWKTECNDSTDSGLHNVQGSVEVIPFTGTNPFFRTVLSKSHPINGIFNTPTARLLLAGGHVVDGFMQSARLA